MGMHESTQKKNGEDDKVTPMKVLQKGTLQKAEKEAIKKNLLKEYSSKEILGVIECCGHDIHSINIFDLLTHMRHLARGHYETSKMQLLSSRCLPLRKDIRQKDL
jgi:hypothetical protein